MQPPITPVPPVQPSMYLETQTQYAQRQPRPPGPYNQVWAAQATVLTVEVQPPDYVLWSLFNTLFLNNFCFGFVALIYSIKARDCKVLRDLEGATRFGKMARIFNFVAIIVGIIIFIIGVVLAATVAKETLKKWNSMLQSVSELRSLHKHD
uniref:interferon-induced transmembrane protein 1-like n=1 Tax=Euleptes europaea TaxID=460621 RepID=UPI0025403E66|nr:interferon-induced transmembrane protein 1-like [Euleptes europaea]